MVIMNHIISAGDDVALRYQTRLAGFYRWGKLRSKWWEKGFTDESRSPRFEIVLVGALENLTNGGLGNKQWLTLFSMIPPELDDFNQNSITEGPEKVTKWSQMQQEQGCSPL